MKKEEIKNKLEIIKGTINAGLNALYFEEQGTRTTEETKKELEAVTSFLDSFNNELKELLKEA